MSISIGVVASIPPFSSTVFLPGPGASQELLLLSMSVVGMGIADWIWGGDDTQASTATSDPGGDDLFDEDGQADDFGDLDGMDDWQDDEFGEMNDAGREVADLEPRVEELEGELESISSTMSTVRSENEEIAESVQDMEENIRKLLEIYEMVTRGVNPFVDDVQQSGGFDGDTFELFESDEDDSQETELDSDIVSADAESFFDEDFTEEQSVEEFDEGGLSNGEQTDADSSEDAGLPSESDEGGLTFEELKEEYESGSAEWGDGGEGLGDETDLDLEESEEATDQQSTPAASEGDDLTESGRTENTIRNTDGQSPPHPSDTGADSDELPADGSEANTANETSDDATILEDGERSEPDKKPYLDQLPAGYSAEVLVMEWLEYLQSHSDLAQTHAAIEYYENMEWISEPVATDLASVLTGMPSADHRTGDGVETRADGSGGTELGIEHHTTSLKYISRLTGGQFRPGSFQIGPEQED